MIPGFLKPWIENEYARIYNIACEALNGKYDVWNKEFPEVEVPEDYPLKECGGTEYCMFIRERQAPILDSINEKHAKFIYLYSDKECNICGAIRTKNGFVSNIYMMLAKPD